ncbi:uncharacterized protein LOC141726125 isoform X3 [Zonotrichia albicollis]|uniref:uncharacterized protein LOC141726125 isoform X3 n=1 Tax=Zonotrichia albicollis TaxID=44394 RepID=UPI003D80CDE3
MAAASGHVVTEVVAFVPQLILFRLSNQLVLAFKHLLGYKEGSNDTQAIYTIYTQAIYRNLLKHLAFVLKKVFAVCYTEPKEGGSVPFLQQ